MKKLLWVILWALALGLALESSGWAQGLCPPGTVAYQNDGSTGTTQYTLTKLNSSGNAVIMTTSDTTGYAGVAILGAGTFGTVCLAQSGLWPLKMDATSTNLHYIQISGTNGGDGHDTGSTSLPVSGGDIAGRVQAASTGSGGFSVVNVFPPEILATNPSGAVTGPGTTVTGDCVSWNGTSGTALLDPSTGVCTILNGTVHAANTFYGTSFSTTSVSPQTVATSPTIAANSQVSFECSGQWSWTGSGAGQLNMQINASQTPQAIWYSFYPWTSSTASKVLVSSTNTNLLASGSSASSTLLPWDIHGYIQWNASTPGTFTLGAATNVNTATLAIPAGAYCEINP